MSFSEEPKVTLDPHQMTRFQVIEKTEQEICVRVDATPTPQISIAKLAEDGGILQYDNRFVPSTEQDCFKISKVTKEDAGQFRISVENCIGKSTANFTIDVLSACKAKY